MHQSQAFSSEGKDNGEDPWGLRTRLSPHLLIAMKAKPCKCSPDAEFLEVQALHDGKTRLWLVDSLGIDSTSDSMIFLSEF
jgi:hypothetical protein